MQIRLTTAVVEEACIFLSKMASNDYPETWMPPWNGYYPGCQCPDHWSHYVGVSRLAQLLAKEAWIISASPAGMSTIALIKHDAAEGEALLRSGWRPDARWLNWVKGML